MKKTRKNLYTLAILAVLAVGGFAVYQNSSFLLGSFGPKLSTLCPLIGPGKTIYVKESATGTKVGTKANPYDSIASAQSALETDSTIKRVCFSGTLDGSLDLDAALPTSLTLTAYTDGAELTSTGMVVSMETGTLATLTMSNLSMVGGVTASPSTSLTLSSIALDGDNRSTALFVGEADTVKITNSSFKNADVGVQTSKFSTDAVGAVSIKNTSFDTMYDAAISSNNVATLTLDGVTASANNVLESKNTTDVTVTSSDFEYDVYGLYVNDTETLAVSKTSFLGGVASMFINNSTITDTTLTCENNFFMGNSDNNFQIASKTKVLAEITNNSFYNNHIAGSIYGNRGDVTYTNNILFADVGGAAFGSTTYASKVTSDYNLFYGDVTLNEPSLTDWQSEGQDAHSRLGDPLFVSTSDLHILFGSPAIDFGTDTSVTDDIDGDARTSGSYDIGADEY